MSPGNSTGVAGGIHPAPSEFTEAQMATDPILHFFHYAHLPEKLRATSRLFFILAASLVSTLPRNAERTVALRKLLEAKDAAVRANLPAPTLGETSRGILGNCRHPMIYAADDGGVGKCTSCGTEVSTAGYAQSAARAAGFLTRLPEPVGEAREIGGHDEDRDGPVPFGG